MSKLDKELAKINEKLGDGTINVMSNFDNIEIERIETGCLSLDYVLGGGLPTGRIIEVYGEPSSGKTVMALFMIREIQKRGGKAAFIDCENSFSVNFAEKIGVDVKKLIFSQAVCAEDVLNIVDSLVKTNELDLIVVDSVASMVPRKELEGEVGDVQMALVARIMSQALRMITGIAAKTKTSLIFLNQTRQKIGIYYGNPNTTGGGKALKFYASIRIEVKKGKTIKEDNEIIGNLVKLEATKNKTAPPFRETEFELYYNSGIDVVEDLLDFIIKKELVKKNGNTLSWGETKLGGSREAAKKTLTEDKVLYEKIYKEVNKV